MPAVKIGISRQVVIPKKIYDKLGLTPGDYLEADLQGERLILTLKPQIEKHLAEALDDIKEGRTYGPFSSPGEMIRSLHHPTKPKKKPKKS